MAEGARLESVYTATYRGFESLPHRQIIRNRPQGRFFCIWWHNNTRCRWREGENPRRVRAEQLAAMNGRRPPRRGEPRSGESSLPHRQIIKNRPQGRFFCIWWHNNTRCRWREGEKPRRVRAEQLAAMNGQRPPRRGEPRSGESSLPHRQIIKSRPQGRFFAFRLFADIDTFPGSYSPPLPCPLSTSLCLSQPPSQYAIRGGSP